MRGFPTSLCIASQSLWQSHRQMLVSTRGGCQTRMPLRVMHQHQRTPSQNFPAASDESPRDQAVRIDRLAVPIDIQTGRSLLPPIPILGFPQMGRPGAKGCSQPFRPIGFGQLARDRARYGNSRKLEAFLSPPPVPLRCILAGHAFDVSREDGKNSSVSSNWRRQRGELESRE